MNNDNSTSHSSSAYDDEVQQTIPFYRQFHAEVIDLVRTVRPDVRVWLDTGGGTGFLPEQAIGYFPNTRFLLADPSAAMLDRAVARLKRFSAESVTILPLLASEDLVGALPARPQVVTAIQCHHYGGAEVRRLATLAIHQVLAPGGVYVTFENIRPDTQAGIETGLKRWLRFQSEAGRSPEVVEAHKGRFDREYFPITIGQHLELLASAGFTTVELFWRSQMQAGFYAVK
jgi:tRNA (cmo5U34)-methyltransferase